MIKNAKKHAGRPKDLEKQAAILLAAKRHFMQHGFDHASMDAIAASANVSKLTIYSHFGSKEELFRAMIRAKCAGLRLAEDYEELTSLSAKAALTQIGKRFLDLMFEQDTIDMNRIIIAEAAVKPKISELLYESGPKPSKAAFAKFLGHMHKRGDLAINDIERATQHFFCLLKGERFQTALMNLQPLPSAKEKAAHLKDCVDVFMRAYAPAPSPKKKK